MANMVIKAHRKDRLYGNPHFFVLNKGYNSGKPQKTPFVNSFVLIFDDEQECENHFHVADSLWRAKFWKGYLTGSPILFLRLDSFKREFPVQADSIIAEHVKHLKMVEEVKLARLREVQFHKNKALLSQAHKENAYWYNRKR